MLHIDCCSLIERSLVIEDSSLVLMMIEDTILDSGEAIIGKPFTAAILRQRLSDLRDMALASAARTSPLLIELPLSLAELPRDG